MPVAVQTEKCDGCGTCQENCPSDAIHLVDKKAVVVPENCIDCNLCQDACPPQAISAAS